jgi:alanyl-tRNA synthetase
LPRPSVDTGAGLERIAAVMQGEDSNFHTDLFLPLIHRVEQLVGQPYDRGPAGASFRVLADHAAGGDLPCWETTASRATTEGCYVLRRILRRAVRHAWLLGRREPTLTPLTDIVVHEMGEVYPALRAKAGQIRQWTMMEEERFPGNHRRRAHQAGFSAWVRGERDPRRRGLQALRHFFGFPLDLTMLIAEERERR